MSSTGILIKKSVLFPVLLTLLVLQAAGFSIGAAEETLSPSLSERNKSLTWGRPSNLVDIGLGYLFFSNTSSWAISFPDQYGRGRSVLDYKGITGGIPIVTLDIHHPNSYASLSFQFGKSQGLNGEGTDSDYLSNGRFYRSRFDVSGETAYWIADLQTTFVLTSKPRWAFKPFIGWQHYEENFNLTNGRWTALNSTDSNTPITGLDSRYDFNWDALRVGIGGDLGLANDRQPGISPLRLKTHLALFPYMHYSGRGVWNLRDDLKKDPSFSHEADNFGVLGLDGAIALIYQPLKFLEIEGGGQMSYFYVQDGKDSTYFSNDTVAIANLDEAKALQIGLFLKITGRF
jgi:hypothetical protein